ncbi:DUF4229 domain-containing protein [Nocardioides sp. 616]|uniref:DUF4229 domain-containing protein n=1 Tax=Nocardioides sp. 616 TaxID=2268090 RepID=UPI000CE4D256|nr:DUF4229 domain-containing protein [Nocardioides sp. 616]
MKEFLVYNVLRLLLLVASVALVGAVWALFADTIPVLGVLVVALLLSGVVSWFALRGPRAALALKIQERADRASAAFEAHKARQDED